MLNALTHLPAWLGGGREWLHESIVRRLPVGSIGTIAVAQRRSREPIARLVGDLELDEALLTRYPLQMWYLVGVVGWGEGGW